MKSMMSLAITALMIGSWSAETLAKQVAISGTHSRAEISRKCDCAGWFKHNTAGKSGSCGCVNLDTGAMIECNDKGSCTG